MTRTPSKVPRPGFSLSELLIALAIIGLAVSLLLPALGRAREHAKLALCKTHLHNLGVGLIMYADQNHSALPVSEELVNPHAELLAALTGNFVPSRENFYCPSETDPELAFSQENFAAGNIGYFYYCCRSATTDRGVSTYLRWDVPWPRELRTDMPAGKWVASDCWFSGQRTAHRFYNKGVNYVTLGGTVGMVQSSPRWAFE